jgi:hypothetical protein
LVDDLQVWASGRTVRCEACGQQWRAVGAGPSQTPEPEQVAPEPAAREAEPIVASAAEPAVVADSPGAAGESPSEAASATPTELPPTTSKPADEEPADAEPEAAEPAATQPTPELHSPDPEPEAPRGAEPALLPAPVAAEPPAASEFPGFRPAADVQVPPPSEGSDDFADSPFAAVRRRSRERGGRSGSRGPRAPVLLAAAFLVAVLIAAALLFQADLIRAFSALGGVHGHAARGPQTAIGSRPPHHVAPTAASGPRTSGALFDEA